MLKFKMTGVICSLVLMITAGAAVAGPMGTDAANLKAAGLSPQVETVVMKGTMAGKMKQRRRTRTTYCRSQPSRC